MFWFSEFPPCCKSSFSFRLTEFTDVFKLQLDLYGRLWDEGRDVEAFKDKGKCGAVQKMHHERFWPQQNCFYFRSPKHQGTPRRPATSQKCRAHVFIPKGKKSCCSFLQSWTKRTLFFSKSCGYSRSITRFWLSLCTTTVQLLFPFKLLLVWCYCWWFWRGFI